MSNMKSRELGMGWLLRAWHWLAGASHDFQQLLTFCSAQPGAAAPFIATEATHTKKRNLKVRWEEPALLHLAVLPCAALAGAANLQLLPSSYLS